MGDHNSLSEGVARLLSTIDGEEHYAAKGHYYHRKTEKMNDFVELVAHEVLPYRSLVEIVGDYASEPHNSHHLRHPWGLERSS